MTDMIKRLYIEPSSRCNLSCKMCFRHTWQDETFKDMDDKTFLNIIDHLPESVESIFFGGMGEPLIHPKIIHMISTASKTGKKIEMITNASLLTPEYSKILIENGLDWLWVSIDSFEPESFGHIRQDKDFYRLLKHLDAFNEARQVRWHASNHVKLGLNFVVSKNNIHQLGKIPSFAYKYTVDHVNISNFIPSDINAEKQSLCNRVIEWDIGLPEPNQCNIDLPMLNWRDNGVMDEVKELLSSTRGQLSISGQPIIRKNKYCKFVEEGMCFIRHDGLVSPCMELLHNSTTSLFGNQRFIKRHTFGNINDSSLSQIWNSNEYMSFRDRVKSFDFSPCLHCSGCNLSQDNTEDCFGNNKPTCGACLWAEGLVSCP